jgi:hypothetical protein
MWLEYNKSNRLGSLIRLAENMSFITWWEKPKIFMSVTLLLSSICTISIKESKKGSNRFEVHKNIGNI